jgi:peptidyl-prolyl cis-trans isomerase C
MDCSLSAALPKPKAVSVNGIAIPREIIAREVQNHPAPKPIEAWHAAARALVVRELLRQEAERLNIEEPPLRDGEGRTETPEEAAIRGLIAREVKTPVPDDEACLRFYQANARRFCSPTLYQAAHILLAAPADDRKARLGARESADAILAVLKADAPAFAALARERSDCRSSAADGGSLGQFSRGETARELERGLDRMQDGEVANVESRYGFHVVRLDRRIEGRQLPFEAVRARIAAYLSDTVERKALAQYVSILAGRAAISGVALEATSSPLVQ